MPVHNHESRFSFIVKDFQSCTGKRRDAQYLHTRFKTMLVALQDNEIFCQAFPNFRGYIARPWNQGLKAFRDYLWLGFAHDQHPRPQDEVQFQVSISKDTLSMEIFIDQAANDARQKVKHNIVNHQDTFLKQLRDLSKCSVGYSGANDFQISCSDINEEYLSQIIQNIGKRRTHFFIGRELTEEETTKYGEQIVPEILYTWLRYRPLYDLMEPNIGDNSIKPAIPINNSQSIAQNIRRQFSSQEIDLDETEAKATERESKQITYEANWLAQEKANSNHRNTVNILAKYIKEHGISPMQSVIDTFVETDNEVFIFEVKSIHLGNFIHQTRTAIGQLLDYEYFQIKNKKESKRKNTTRGIVYNKKPTQEITDFLTDIEFSVFWIEDGKISGTAESMQKLAKFLSSK